MQILKDEVRDDIKDAALDLFLRQGYEKASMKLIAAAAGVSASNIYHYFTSKGQLFSELVDPVHQRLHQLIGKFQEDEKGRSFSDKAFIQQFTRSIVLAMSALIKTDRRQLLLLFDGSRGTAYETSKEAMISFFEDHFGNAAFAGPVDTSFVMRLFAKNLVEGLIEIVRCDRSEEWILKSIEELITYHVSGMAPFFP